MKNLLSIFILISLSFLANGQTNVIGTISTNTTWTVGGSPYIVIDTVLISPGVKLTIQPGVTVKFANNALLLTYSQINNYSSIVAIGTITDSITFTSNSTTPTSGNWSGIHLGGGNDSSSIFSYCNFKYAEVAIIDGQGVLDLLTISNCNFDSNVIGIQGTRQMHIFNCTFRNNTNYCIYKPYFSTISNCIFSNNQIGICGGYTGVFNGGQGISLKNCIIDSNQIGITGFNQYSEINNCIVRFNHYGIIFNYGTNIKIKGNIIDSNIVAGISINAGNILIDSCQINYNGIGIVDSGGTSQSMVTRNRIEYNSIGIILVTANDDFHCNKICNNTLYNLKSRTANNINIANNYWCTPDSISTKALIFDGNDSTTLGFVNFMPLDTVQCYTGCYISFYFNLTLQSCQTCSDGTATAIPTNGSAPYSYEWNTSPIQTTQTATGLSIGTYTVTITDSLGCFAISSINFSGLGIKDIMNKFSFTIFPNPNSSSLSVELPSNVNMAEIKIYNIVGELKGSWFATKQKTNIDISFLANGIYIIQVSTSDNYGRQKLIKK